MTTEQIATLLAGRGKKKSSTGKKGHAYVRNSETGGLDKVPLSVLSSVGQYEGKQGTVKRSRKGAIRIQPNGSRYYCPNWEVEVVSYTAK